MVEEFVKRRNFTSTDEVMTVMKGTFSKLNLLYCLIIN